MVHLLLISHLQLFCCRTSLPESNTRSQDIGVRECIPASTTPYPRKSYANEAFVPDTSESPAWCVATSIESVCPFRMCEIGDDLGKDEAFLMIREDTAETVMAGIPMPNTNHIALFRSKGDVNAVMERIYGEDYLGIVKGNSLGTEFALYDNGMNPALVPEEVFDDISRNVLCRIEYGRNIMGRKPNKMEVFIPPGVGFGDDDSPKRVAKEVDASELSDVKVLRTSARLVTKKPSWSTSFEGWT